MADEKKIALPNERGWFGDFGGRFVPETLMHAHEELTEAYEAARPTLFSISTVVL